MTVRNDEIDRLYRENFPLISSLARRYSKIDPSVSYEDFIQEAYIAVANAIKDFIPRSGLNFSSFLFWHLQKRFHGLLKDDKVVEVRHPDGELELISYGAFLRIKRKLPGECQWRVLSTTSSLEELEEGGIER
jgi:RNA polymerase sigma factor (sigma-70 family)